MLGEPEEGEKHLTTDMKAALRVGLISSIVPKRCGIATFSRDLIVGMWATNPHVKIFAVAAEDPDEGYDY